MFSKIKKMVDRFDEIETLLAKKEIVSDQIKFASLMRERGQLYKIVAPYKDFCNVKKQKEEAEKMLSDDKITPDMRELAQEELESLKQKENTLVAKLEEIFLTEDSDSNRNVIVEIRPGTGGEESSLFAYDLLRMYTKFIEKKGWVMEITDLLQTEVGGIRYVTFIVEGEDVYKFLRYESGCHRVQRVPKTETQGRIHTSVCTVAILPEAEDVKIEIKKEDIKMDVYRAGGPGGQNVNKTSSAVRLTHIPTGIVVACQTNRSQHRNKELAMRLLKSKLHNYRENQKKSERDTLRKTQVGTGERNEKIRTYNFPQNRITDHRINYSIYNLEDFLNGNMDELIQKLIEYDKEKKLESLKGK